MKLSRSFFGAMTTVFLTACYLPPTTNERPVAQETMVGASEGIALPTLVTLTGQLDFRPFEPIKAYKSFNGLEFFLTNESSQTYNLAESEIVSREKLMKLDDHNVEVQGYWYTPPEPASSTSFPIDDHGNPMKRSERLKVVSIRAIVPN